MKSTVQVRMRYPAFCNIDFDSQAMCEFTRMREHKSMKATRHRSTTLIAVVEIIYTSGASEIDGFIDLLLIAASTRTEIARSMASFTLALLSAALLLCSVAQAQLSSSFYSRTCPSLQRIVQSTMAQAVNKEPRMAASILRLFFHDCFVNGCDASILLDDTATFTGEKNAFPNINSARGYEVIDAIKSNVEAACPQTVSCADILALAARDGVSLVGGPNWKVSLGRRDATTASQSDANSNLPGPSSSLSQLVASFAAKGLSARDMTALSGAHTIGRAQCANFRSHIYDDANIDPGFAAARRRECPSAGGDGNLAPFDLQTPDRFDNSYYQNLVAKRGMLHSDQELFNNGTQDKLVRRYSVNGKAFAKDFASAMMRMGAISPLTGASGEIRLNCRVVNK